MTRPRVLFHVQHLLGIGHWQRIVALARVLDRIGMAATILSGGFPVPEAVAGGGVEILQLPPARAGDPGFRTVVDAEGRLIDESFRNRRRDLVLAALARFKPQVLVIESFPFGRRAFRFELSPLIDAAFHMTPRPAILSSIRDVLVTKRAPSHAEEVVATIEHAFDAILVHGDPDIIALDASFPLTDRIAHKLLYTGYVATNAGADDGISGTGEVIVSAGGGAVGSDLMRAALGARGLCSLAGAPWRLLAGPHLPDADFAALRASLPGGMVLERFRRDLPAMLSRCLLSISQGGYNTIVDIMRSGARAIVVPFGSGDEDEQRRRGEPLEKLGVLQLVDGKALSAKSLAAAIDRRMGRDDAPTLAVRCDGAERGAQIIADFAIGKGRASDYSHLPIGVAGARSNRGSQFGSDSI